ncbi:receptor-like protein 12 [Prunus avium]|uniref:Receptor-like protein 12 n=1 Tax=Prunus avium TaxID=42229 RepID=A0A6P5U4B8_PRUAV|nr:receptor-like protein 12 [Prunus avium]
MGIHLSIRMLSKLLVLLLFHLVVANFVDSLQQLSCHAEESSALLQFKESFMIDKSASSNDGAYPKVSSWKPVGGGNSSCCSWDGVECDEMTGHVIGLNLSSSYLYGSLDSNSSLFSLVHLQRLSLSDNNFNYSQIPSSIRNFPGLTHLDLSWSFFSGQVPSEVSHLSKLTYLDLCCNVIENGTPGHPDRLLKLQPSDMRSLGQLPRSLANCVMLEYLVLSNNQFSDVFPIWLGTLPELKLLTMRHNGFNGVIGQSRTNFDFPKLRILDLSYNNFTGEIPPLFPDIAVNMSTYMQAQVHYAIIYVGRSVDYSITLAIKGLDLYYSKVREGFAAIDISNNKFEGKIPKFIGNLKELRSLNISSNILTGSIPSSLGNLRNLESLDLSQNKLLGQIPQQLTQLSFLGTFNVSHNNLTGPIPQGTQLTSFNSTSYDGNLGLCGDPLPNKCGNQRPPSTKEDNGSGSIGMVEFDFKFVLAGIGSGCVLGVVLADVLITRRQELFLRVVGMVRLIIWKR